MISDHISDGFKHLIDGLSVITLLGTLVHMFPSIAAGLTIVWTLLRIWETETVKHWTGRDK